MPTDSITAPEADLLAFCERKIAAGFSTFCEVGDALLKIRDARLYRASHSSFEAYCREKWGMTRRRADQLIEASAVVIGLASENNCSQLVTESQARELAKVPEDARAEVLKEAAQASPVTAKAIKAAAQKRNVEPNDEPPRVQCGLPAANLNDEESRAHRITRAVIKACEELEAVLAGMNATPRELIQAAESLRGRAKRLEFNAAKLAEDSNG